MNTEQKAVTGGGNAPRRIGQLPGLPIRNKLAFKKLVNHCECCGAEMQSNLPHCATCHRELWTPALDEVHTS